MTIPFFISSIVKCLQSDMIITLGTIGALAIIRFRTAIKDPQDMLFLLWSIFIGISCGCSLYKMCLFTSLFVSVVLIIINLMSNRLNIIRSPYILIINCKEDLEHDITKIINKYVSKSKVKSRNYSVKGVNYVFEFNLKNRTDLCKQLKENENIIDFSLIEYDDEDII